MPGGHRKNHKPATPPAAHAAQQPPAEHDRAAQPVDAEEKPRLDFPVVGIGASAGGLEAVMEFIAAMPPDSGMAFVLIQHLPPDRETLIPAILSKKTSMPVHEIEDGMAIEPDHVYVIRPGRTLTINHGHFRMGEKLSRPMHHRPVDDFFRSLAQEQRERAVAIIMSGMGSNGTAGCQGIKAVGGLCIAQEPGSAKFPSMPQHLIDAGYADYILKPAEMPEVLVNYAAHPYTKRDDAGAEQAARDLKHLREVLAVLRTRTRHDFGGYKKPTVLRRIQRRMGLTRLTDLGEYAKVLRQTPAEVTALADDLLIHVTGFFRDPEAWEALRERVIVPLVESREPGGSIRAWVAACSSGEEAYTLVILLAEEAERAEKALEIKVFATDTAERTLHNARHGVYPGGIESEITPERLERFFKREGEVYRIRQDLREAVVFAPQDVLQDPPFSRLDIATCRNLLIYLEPEQQQRVLTMMHFGLRDGGALFLGSSETVGGLESMYEPLDKRARIFRRVGPTRHGNIEFPLPRSVQDLDIRLPERPPLTRQSVGQRTARALLDFHTPAAITVDRDLRVVFFHGNIAPVVAEPAGEPTRDLMAILREPVRRAARTAIHQAVKSNTPTEVGGAEIEFGGLLHVVSVTATPISAKGEADLIVVGFQIRRQDSKASPQPGDAPETPEDLRRVRDELQSAVEELQTSNEELKAAHEEVVSTNEELQSTNEELETSREEMQSLNEEISTVNAQLQAKMDEHLAVSNDLASLLTSTDLAVLFLDTQFRIRRFTPQVRELMDVIATDVGRPLSDLARKFDDPALIPDAASVLQRLVPVEREVTIGSDRWFARRITAYRTADNRIDGVVVTFVDITDRHKAVEDLKGSEAQFRRSIEHAPIPILLQSEVGRIVQVSRAWTEITGQRLADLTSAESWINRIVEPEAAGAVRMYLQLIASDDARLLDLECSMRVADGPPRHWKLRASCPGKLAGGDRFVMFAAVDITERTRAERALAEAKLAAEAASAHKDAFIASMSHELRTPLSNILTWSRLLRDANLEDPQHHEAVEVIARNAESQRRLIEDLLDNVRIASGKLRLNLGPFDPAEAASSVVRSIAPTATARGIQLEHYLQDDLGAVIGDAGRFEQIVWNLLNNAVKFTPAGGTVRLSLHAQGPMMVVEVVDTGRGIAPEFMPSLFAPFTQAPEKRGVGKSGLGLGLSIVKSLVELQSGTVAAASKGEGRGATFTVHLPLVRKADAANVGPAPESAPLAGVRVLLAEDNGDALRAIKRILEASGAEVDDAMNGRLALDLFEQGPPELIVSDLNMPVMDGFAFMKAVRDVEAKRGGPRTPAVALSAHTAGEDRSAATMAGFDRFVAKPFEPAALIAEAVGLLRVVPNGD